MSPVVRRLVAGRRLAHAAGARRPLPAPRHWTCAFSGRLAPAQRGLATVPPRGAYDAFTSPTRVHDVFNPRVIVADGQRASWVSDVGALLDGESRGEIDAICGEVHANWRMEVAVVVLDSLPEDVRPSAFAAALLNFWGIGDARLHSGLLVLLLLGQRRLEMRLGFGAQRVFSPEMLKALQEERMVPHLRAGAPGIALREGVRGILESLGSTGPKHWRRGDGAAAIESNRHGFGGGQTPIDAFVPKEAPKEAAGALPR